MRPLFAGVAFIALLLSAAAVYACAGGDDNNGAWSLDWREYAGSNGLPFLSPGNDSRINLQLLMLDVHPGQAAEVAPAAADVNLNNTPIFSMDDLVAAFKAGSRPSTPDASSSDQAGGSTFADGEGTRCVSAAQGAQGFVDAVQAEPAFTADEKTSLIQARNGMAPTCDKPDASAQASPPPASTSAASPAAQEFLDYLAGAKAFYLGDFDTASASFGKLAKAQNAWLREAARYMAGRTLLNKAEIGAFGDLDGAPEPKVTDRASLTASEAAFNDYLTAYPAGRYAVSARGLLRRLYWLAGDQGRLAAEYGWQIIHIRGPLANLDGPDLAQEIDSKYLSSAARQGHDPYLLAVADLMRLRKGALSHAAFPAADVEAQAPDFTGHEDLFVFLKAARAYYADGDFAATLKLLGPAQAGPPPPTYLAFSREMLRGQALMASGQIPAAVDHWKALLASTLQPWRRETVELGLALSWEQAGTINKVFAPETRIASPRIRGVLLRYAAGPILLRQAVADPQSTPSERALARYVLLFKEATHGHYSGFLRDYSPEEITTGDAAATQPGDMKSSVFLWKGASEPYQCASLKGVMGELAANPNASHALLCLGEFIRTAGLEDTESGLPKADELGGGKSIFPGEAFSRGEMYKKLVSESSTPSNDKAYALYRLVNCYAPSNNNTCGGKDVDKSQRKEWFELLKTKYGSTPWARAATYYW